MNSSIYPYLLKPAYKDYIWGGTRIPQLFGRTLPKGIYAESWELSDRPEGPSTITNGPMAGRLLSHALHELGPAITGTSARMPLLIKLIDAAGNLSVQVHPHDSNAHLTGGEPKTEMWYVLDAADDAKIYAGLKHGVSRDDFESALAANRLETCLNSFSAKKGDVFYIPGGRVHAIGAGCLLLEVQQNSNTTYRVHDWGRVEADGSSRQLHIKEALQVINWNDVESPLLRPVPESRSADAEVWSLISTAWFRLSKVVLTGKLQMRCDRTSFHSIFPERGTCRVEYAGGSVTCRMGQTCLIPAALTDWSISSESANFLCSSL